MNRIFNLCLPVAVSAIMLSQIPTAQGANNRRGGGGGGGGGRPAAAHVSAPAHFAAARPQRSFAAARPQRSFAARSSGMTARRTFASRGVTGRSAISRNRVSTTANRNLALSRSRTGTAGTTGITRGTRQLARLNGTATNRLNTARTGAIGANRISGANGVSRASFGGADPRSTIANNQFAFRSGNFNRGWNPGRTYFWNDCRWGCYGGVWAVFGIGWPYDWYDYPYPFMYDNVVYYRGDAYEPGPAIGSSLAADVQSTLANQGYNPGPSDGVVGPRTSEAISEYQGDHGMTPTGQIDTPLLQSLGLQ